jgi:hypothetical protein
MLEQMIEQNSSGAVRQLRLVRSGFSQVPYVSL